MKILPLFRQFSALACLIALSACNSTSSSSARHHYPAGSVGVAHDLQEGEIIDLHDVIIDGTGTMAGVYGGATAGGIVGGVAGAQVTGTSTGAALGTATGALAGAVVGPRIEKAMTSRKAQEMTIRLKEGRVIVVVQENRYPEFMIGERVRVHTNSYGHVRVYHSDEDPYIDEDTGAYLPEDFENPDL